MLFLAILLIEAAVISVRVENKIDPQRFIRDAEGILATVDSYTAIFHKQERINRQKPAQGPR